MGYQIDQMVRAYTAVHLGVEPSAAMKTTFETMAVLSGNLQLTDAQILSNIVNSADDSTALAIVSYQFFMGKSSSLAGLKFMVHSDGNPNDLSDAYYSRFNLENRYINFAANLGVNGDGAAAFAAKYGAMNFADYVASIYETIIGASTAKAAGVDVPAAIAYLIGTKDAVLATVTSAGMVNANSTPADIDIAVKAAMAGLVMAAAIKADIGVYAAAADNLMVALATGTAVYGTDITRTYAPTLDSASHGTGKAVDRDVYLPSGSITNPLPSSGSGSLSLRLTTGTDNLTGSAGDNIFDANDLIGADHFAVFTTGDVLDGGLGNDTLNIISDEGPTYNLPTATVSNIETANITFRGASGASTVPVTTWVGLTTLNVNAVGGTGSVTVGSIPTADATVTLSNQAFSNLVVQSGRNVTVNATNGASGTITIGPVSSPTGAIVVNVKSNQATALGAIVVNGGTTVTVNAVANNAVNTTQTTGAISVNGGSITTSVTVNASTAVTASGSSRGVVANTVNIVDLTGNASVTKASITSVSVDGASSVSVRSNALANATFAHTSGNLSIDNASALAPGDQTTGLSLTLNGVAGGVFNDANVYEALGITTGAEASTLTNINDTALTLLTLDGASKLTLTNTTGMTSLQTVTVTGAAGIAADLSMATFTSLTASTSGGANTVTINGANATYSGGYGVDTVTVTGATPNKAINLSDGNDLLDITGITTLGASATFNGGSGAADVLRMTATQAVTFGASGVFATKTTNFERLVLLNATSHIIDLATLGNYHYVTTRAGAGLTLNGFSSGDTLELDGFGTSYTLGSGNFGGANDVMNLKLTDSSGSAVDFASGVFTAANLETINITVTDGQATPTGSFLDLIRFAGNTLTTITVSGNAGLGLTAGSSALTSVDASGITLGGFNWTAGVLASAATVKGSATGLNNVTFNFAAAAVTYTGGSGTDTVTSNNAMDNVFNLGAGNNSVSGGGGNNTITAGAGSDFVTLTTGNNIVDLGNGPNGFTATSGNNTYTGGTGVDTVTVGGGQNSINVGSGNDVVRITAANVASNTVFTSITGFGAGDKLTITAQGGSAAATVLGSEITGQASLAAYLDAAAAGNGSATSIVHWFQFGGDTYVVQDGSAGATFNAGTDIVVKLVGGPSLATSALVTGTLTL